MAIMKDSGNKRIGKIPENWEIKRTKYVAQLYTGNSIKDEEKELYEDPIDAVPYLSSKDINATFLSADYNNGMFVKLADDSFKFAPTGSTLMCIEGGSAGRKKTHLTEKAAFVNKLCCFNPTNIDHGFLYHWLCSPNYEDEFRQHITGLIGGVSVSVLQNFEIAIPPRDEQVRIAKYLDHVCSKIDHMILETEKSIKKYKALKQSFISEAVSRGIIGDRRMKNSGIEWIKTIPEDWSVIKIKYIASLVTDGAHISPETEDGVFDFVSTVNIDNGKIDYAASLKTSLESYNYLVATGCKPLPGDVLISKDGTVGKTAVVKEDRDFVVASSLVIIRPLQNKISSSFLNYALQSKMVQDSLLLLMHGTGLKRVSVAKNANLIIFLPPIDEQKEISRFLDSKCAKIDELIESKRHLIQTLSRYKKSLVYEYVTGKKEVPVCQ